MRWLPAGLLCLAAALCMAWFSPESFDSDFWWHLKTGQYVLEHRALPLPDPFAYTTPSTEAYPGEQVTRHFNLTHEWLAEVMLFLVYRASGFPGVVLFRAGLLTLLCALVGLVAYRRCGNFSWSITAAMVTATMAIPFALDRPYLITFLMLVAVMAILEFRRHLWLLPLLFLLWANLHGGYFLGWVVLLAYTLEAPRQLWMPGAASVLLSGVNPNGFRIPQILLYYRNSYLTSSLQEWARPRWWTPSEFSLLLFGTGILLLWAGRKVRLPDWILFAAFAASALAARRNLLLLGIIAPVLLVSYLPWKNWRLAAAASLALAAWGFSISGGNLFQLRAAEWRYPGGAADFLLRHHVTGPIFNTYEFGGYLIWRLWPQERVFIDGRALSESVYNDYGRILYDHDSTGGKSAQELLDQYGIQTIVMNTLECYEGLVYNLAPALADPQQTDWTLVYSDPSAIVLMRHPPPDVQPLPSLAVLEHMEAECSLHLEHDPKLPLCAHALAQVFSRVGDAARIRRWLRIYLDHPHEPDPQAEEAYRRLIGAGR